MKKSVIFGTILVTLLLSGCSSQKKEETSGKVDHLESRVKKLENSSSLETKESTKNEEEILSSLKSETNKKIAKAFIDNNLEFKRQEGSNSYEYIPEPSDAENNPKHFKSQMGFKMDGITSVSGIAIENFESAEDLANAEKYLRENFGEIYLASNNSLMSLMYTQTGSNPEEIKKEFDQYKEVFERIK